MRESAKIAAARGTTFLFAGAGGYGVGYIDGWAERTNKKLTIGTSTVRWPMAVSLVLGGVGALAPKLLGDQAADVAMGLGAGGVAGELALTGRRSGLTPPPPPPATGG
jgi:hypothetical protein